MMIHYSERDGPEAARIIGGANRDRIRGRAARRGLHTWYIHQSVAVGRRGMTDYLSLMKAKLAALDEERRRLMATLGILDEVDSDALRSVLALPASVIPQVDGSWAVSCLACFSFAILRPGWSTGAKRLKQALDPQARKCPRRACSITTAEPKRNTLISYWAR